jgi:hypothetical protein
MKSIVKWFKDLFLEEFEVTIWFKGGTEYNPEEFKRDWRMKKIITKKQTHFVGIDIDGNMVEIKTTTPFDYRIRKIH